MNLLAIKKLGAAEVIVDIVPKGNIKIRPANSNSRTQIAVHNTGNANKGAGAKNHRNYLHNQAKLPANKTAYASYHFVVDDKYIYQLLPLNESAWHTGDGSGVNSGNRNAIGIEICENPDMDYKQAEENAIALIVYLMKELKINIQNVKPHKEYSGKHCPRVILNRDGSFTPFRKRIETAYKGTNIGANIGTNTNTNTCTYKIGEVTADVWTQKTSVYSAERRVKVIRKGDRYKVYGEENGFYNLGSEFVNKKYMKIVG